MQAVNEQISFAQFLMKLTTRTIFILLKLVFHNLKRCGCAVFSAVEIKVPSTKMCHFLSNVFLIHSFNLFQ